MIPHIKTSKLLVIMWSDGTPKNVSVDHTYYEEIHDIVMNSSPSEEIFDRLEELVRPVIRLKSVFENDRSGLTVAENGVMTYTHKDLLSFEVPLDLAKTVLELHDQYSDITPFVKFIHKLAQNPDYRVVNQLWGFIKACGLCLTEDGNFMAYKNVRIDYKSIADSKTDNTPGTVLKMSRNTVDNNPNNTCSTGLHFAAWGYLKHYAWGQRTVLLSISPKDVVSIPTDYNNQKGRACRYKVIRDVEQPEELKSTLIFDDYEDDDYCEDCDSDDCICDW